MSEPEQPQYSYDDYGHVFSRGWTCTARKKWLSQGLEHYVSTGKEKEVKNLMRMGASPNSLVGDGDDTVLHLAVIKRNGSIVRALATRRGAAKNKLNKKGKTPLHLAAFVGNLSATHALLDAGANVDFLSEDDHSSSALGLAARQGHVKVMELLIKRRANVNAADAIGYTALHHATARNKMRAVKTLLTKAATNVNAHDVDGQTPLHLAAKCEFIYDVESKLKLIGKLANAGANVNARNESGQTPLHVAVENIFMDVVSLLIERGADTNMLDNGGKTPLHVVVFSHPSTVAAEILLDAGANANFRRSPDEPSLLDMAAAYGHVDVLQTLLRYGANVGATDSRGLTALHYAVDEDSVGVMNALLEAGAGINNQSENGCTPLHFACQTMSPETVRCLLVNGAMVNVPDVHMQLPLHFAARGAFADITADIVDLLLNADADETATDDQNRTPAQVVGLDVLPEDGWAPPHPNVRVRGLLASAPADRAWRRRRFLTMCRARPNKAPVRSEFKIDSSGEQTYNGMLQERCTKAAKKVQMNSGGVVVGNGGGGGDGSVGGDAGIVGSGRIEFLVSRVVTVAEDGIFRNIVEFL